MAKFTDVTCGMLEGMGAKGVMVDIDNTIVTHKSNEVTQEIIDWFGVLRGHGYEMYLQQIEVEGGHLLRSAWDTGGQRLGETVAMGIFQGVEAH